MKSCITLLVTVLFAGVLAPTPTAEAAQQHAGWANIKRLGVEHRAQACRYRALGGEQRIIELRGNSRRAWLRSAYRMQFFVDGELFSSYWRVVPAGGIGSGYEIPDDAYGGFRVRMKIRTVYGTTAWGAWHGFRELPRCH